MGFAAGFSAGSQGLNQAIRMGQEMKRQKAMDERQAKLDARADEEYNYGIQQRANVDKALASYQGLQKGVVTGEADWGSLPSTGDDMGPQQPTAPMEPTAAGGGALKTRKATRSESVAARTNIALAQRDVKALGGLEAEGRDAAWDDGFTAAMADYKGTPEQIEESIKHINGNSSRITVTDPDKNGVIRATVVKADNRAEYMKLSRADQAKLHAANKMMEQDPQKALQIISGVNKELGAAAAADMGVELKVGELNEKNRAHVADEAHKGRALGVTEKHYDNMDRRDQQRLGLQERVATAQINGMNARAAGGSGGGAGGKLSSPEAFVKAAEDLVRKGQVKTVQEGVELLKKGVIRDRDGEAWGKIETDIFKAGGGVEEVTKARQAFRATRGYAPDLAEAAIASGVDPQTKKRLTVDDVMAFNKRYPMSAIEPMQLPWIAKEVQNEQRRQGLITQIPR